MSENADGKVRDEMPNTEVVVRAKRKRFTAAEKVRILREVEACRGSGEIGALLRREGIYSSSLTAWRKQRELGEPDGLRPHKRGPKVDLQAVELVKSRRENERLQERLRQAELIINVQKKSLRCLARPSRHRTLRPAQGRLWTIRVDRHHRAIGRKHWSISGLPGAGDSPQRSLSNAPNAARCPKPEPLGWPRALQPTEKAEVRQVLNSDRFADQTPREVYATLIDEGKYLCSWRTRYRILDENQEVRERRNQL